MRTIVDLISSAIVAPHQKFGGAARTRRGEESFPWIDRSTERIKQTNPAAINANVQVPWLRVSNIARRAKITNKANHRIPARNER